MTVIYEQSFDANEWFVILNLVVMHVLILISPKILPLLEGLAHYLYGPFIGMFWDHTISVRPWDFYDVNDNSSYQVMDVFSYIMFGPYSYFVIYLYVKLGIKGYTHILYVIVWAGLALIMEWIGVQLGLYHYDKGYQMYWSFPIYLLTLGMQIVYHHLIQKEKKANTP
ncbi:hypothetical protein [Ammoniphilus sp. YIM 78166]|uniref:hypothetical protein n=1 Tax=Ammoniphilus sp. YIM 78166 TaxID=1644106 RepID=UPI00106F254C|nr:hypothetical protein [Ammoniphilus sp. YIM 78166]